MTELESVDVGGLRLVYRAVGDPSAPPMVLLHGLGGDGSSWDEVAAAFADSYRVYALDLRGHGKSDYPGVYSFELMRDDVLGLLNALGLDRVTLVAHSMGGTVAFLLAEDHPERIVRLVVEDTPPPFAPSERLVIPERPDGPLPFDWLLLVAIFGQLNEPDPAWWDRAAEIPVPTLIIAGGPESTVPQDRIAEIAKHIPDCRLVTIPAGHHVHQNRPAEFIATVRAFLTPGEDASESESESRSGS
jgi:3-oxoadipate enol-lactonase